jgi:hypothetical protein
MIGPAPYLLGFGCLRARPHSVLLRSVLWGAVLAATCIGSARAKAQSTELDPDIPKLETLLQSKPSEAQLDDAAQRLDDLILDTEFAGGLDRVDQLLKNEQIAKRPALQKRAKRLASILRVRQIVAELARARDAKNPVDPKPDTLKLERELYDKVYELFLDTELNFKTDVAPDFIKIGKFLRGTDNKSPSVLSSFVDKASFKRSLDAALGLLSQSVDREKSKATSSYPSASDKPVRLTVKNTSAEKVAKLYIATGVSFDDQSAQWKSQEQATIEPSGSRSYRFVSKIFYYDPEQTATPEGGGSYTRGRERGSNSDKDWKSIDVKKPVDVTLESKLVGNQWFWIRSEADKKPEELKGVIESPKKPATGTDKPATGTDKPATGTDKPATGTDKPATGTDKPATGTNKPATGTDKPATGTDKPATGTDKPATGTNKPATGTDKPATGTDKPATGTDKPATGTDKPATGTDKPATGTDKPKNDLGFRSTNTCSANRLLANLGQYIAAITVATLFDVTDAKEVANGLKLDEKSPPADLDPKDKGEWADTVKPFLTSSPKTLVALYNDHMNRMQQEGQGLKGLYQPDLSRYADFNEVITILAQCRTLVELGGVAAGKATGPESLSGLETLGKLLKFGQSTQKLARDLIGSKLQGDDAAAKKERETITTDLDDDVREFKVAQSSLAAATKSVRQPRQVVTPVTPSGDTTGLASRLDQLNSDFIVARTILARRTEELMRARTQSYSAWRPDGTSGFYSAKYRYIPAGSDNEVTDTVVSFVDDPDYVYYFNGPYAYSYCVNGCWYTAYSTICWGRLRLSLDPFDDTAWESLPQEKRSYLVYGARPASSEFSSGQPLPRVPGSLDPEQLVLWPRTIGLPGRPTTVAYERPAVAPAPAAPASEPPPAPAAPPAP